MSKIVSVHGIAQQVKGEESLRASWLPSLRDGLIRAGSAGAPLEDKDFVIAFYGDLFRPPGRPGDKALDFPWEASDIDDDWEREVLAAWWAEAARVDSHIPRPDEIGGKARTPMFVQSALDALMRSRFFSGLAERAMIGNLKQVKSYIHNEEIRTIAQSRLEGIVRDDTRVLIGHSLGSVVAYEGLCAHQGWNVRVFVTLGSPLGIPHLIFNRLRPPPVSGKGAWPGKVRKWINVADTADIVALTKELAPLFNGNVEDWIVNNDAHAHDVAPYLTAAETGRAIAVGLAEHDA